MIWINLFFLALSIFLYCLLGGADFGAGVHELFTRKQDKRQHEELVKEALGPVWEANHMWLLIAIVILFTGFPAIYTQISIHLHIPLTLMLFGIILRGCAFTFRHYDAIQDDSRRYYSLIFSVSSILTPVSFGIIIGSLMSGYILKEPTTYVATFIEPWFHSFSISLGLFVLSIFSFIAGVFMLGEHSLGSFRQGYIIRAKIAHLLMIILGACVFITGESHAISLLSRFVSNTTAIVCFILASVSHFILWQSFSPLNIWRLRITAAFQLMCILGGWVSITFPQVIFYADHSSLSFFSSGYSSKTHFWLAMALITGSLFFIPLLVYLFYIFKLEKKRC